MGKEVEKWILDRAL